MYFTDYEIVFGCLLLRTSSCYHGRACLSIGVHDVQLWRWFFQFPVLPDPSGIETSSVNACGMKYMCCVPFVI